MINTSSYLDNNLNSLGSNKAQNLQNKVNTNLEDQALKKSCMEFEAIFIKEMLTSMKSTVNKSGLIKENMGEKLFDDMLYDEYATKMSKTSEFGIGDMMYRQLSKYNS